MLRVVVLCLLLAGCGGQDSAPAYDPASDNHGFGWHYDAQGPRGLKLRFRPSVSVNSFLAVPHTFEQWFDAAQQCTGLLAPMMPFVIVEEIGALNPMDGFYYSAPPLIRLEAHNAFIVFNHEVVHYLLDMNTGDLDTNHTSNLFTKCGPLQITSYVNVNI